METTDMLKRAKESAEDVIKSITKKENMTPNDLENLTKSVCLVEKIKKLEESMQGGSNGGGEYSGNSSYRRGRSPNTGRFVSRDGSGDGGSNNSYEHEYDYANDGGGSGNSSYRRSYYRDGSNNAGGSSYRRYYDGSSRNNNVYSVHSTRDRMIAKLESMYDEVNSDHERQLIDEWINRLDNGR